MVGKQLGHYVVLGALGAGGMGDVYVAHDTRLDRRVALKLPRREISESVDRTALLEREARAAAALNHPNIVHLYSVEEFDGLIFITMELVDGRSLREILSEEGPLGLGRALAFAAQIAEGLACAHAAGVVHRDLKPANVMVTGDDRVKILDFGVAKFFRSPSTWNSDAATTVKDISSGQAVGTVGYMSPEQALGKALDARTDLFALGVILFEMTTGKAPFAGGTPAVVFDQLLNRRPPSPLTLNASLPTSLATLIDKALAKDPEQRYRSAEDLLHDLKSIDSRNVRSVAAEGLPETRMPSSIVVLPFLDLSRQRDQEYFCHGITEEIISSLTTVSGLRVISRTSAFAFHGKNLDVTEIGRRLGVGNALEGSVRRVGDRVRVTAQLVDTQNGYQLWSKRFERELSDVFAIQDEIAGTIVTELRRGLVGQHAQQRASSNVAAYDAYLRGMYALNKWTYDSIERAIGDFREAIAGDGGFAPAYTGIAEACIWLYSGVGLRSADESVPVARWAVEKALELDPTFADGHRLRALIAMNHDWDRRGAEEGLTRALQLAPGSAASHLWNAWRLALLERRYEQAFSELEEAERLDPLDVQLKTQIGYIHYFHHDLARATKQFERVLTLEPSFAFAHYALGDVCTQTGQFDRAVAEFHRAIELGGRSVNHVGVLGYAYGRSGNRDRANEHLQELMTRVARASAASEPRKRSGDRGVPASERVGGAGGAKPAGEEIPAGGTVPAVWIAMVHLGLGEYDRVFEWLQRAFDERDGSLILITSAVEFDPVRDDPRFVSLLHRMGLAHLA